MAGYRNPRDHGYGYAKIGWHDRNPYPVSSRAYDEFVEGVGDFFEARPRPNGDITKKPRRDRERYELDD